MNKYLSISIASMLGLNAPMKTKFKSTIRAACHSFGEVVCAGAVMLICSSAQAQPIVWYDSGRQAIAVDVYGTGGFGHSIDIDFNDDHTSVFDIGNFGVFQDLGLVTYLGVSYVLPNGSGLHTMGNLFENTVENNISVFANYSDSDKVHYFVEEWNPAQGMTTIYVQPTDSAGSIIPVLPSDLPGTWYSLDYGAWQPVPEPAALSLLALGGLMILRRWNRLGQ